MGPGPSEVPTRVLQAQARPTIGHLDPAFQGLMEEVKSGLARLFRASDHSCIPLPGPGTAGMEAAMLNLLEPGDVAVVAVNGVFGGRLADMAQRAGAEVVLVEHAWGEPITSLGGISVNAAEWDADVLYSGTQKCLSAPPGLSPFAFGRRAKAAIQARKSKPRTWLNDLSLLMSYWGGEGGRAYPHTAPINAIYGLHEALVVLFEEGQEASFARHLKMHEALASGLAALGLDFHVAKAHRLPQLNTVVVPDGVDETAVRQRMLDRFGVEIGSGLGPLKGKVWRIGLMGASASPRHVRLCLAALAEALAAQGQPASIADALTAAEARF